MKNAKMPEFYMIFARKIPFSRILGAIPGSKAESELRQCRIKTLEALVHSEK